MNTITKKINITLDYFSTGKGYELPSSEMQKAIDNAKDKIKNKELNIYFCKYYINCSPTNDDIHVGIIHDMYIHNKEVYVEIEYIKPKFSKFKNIGLAIFLNKDKIKNHKLIDIEIRYLYLLGLPNRKE